MRRPAPLPRHPPFVRPLRLGSVGLDVVALKRALQRARYGRGEIALRPQLRAPTLNALHAFQRGHRLPVGDYGHETHRALAPYYDRYGIWLLVQQQKIERARQRALARRNERRQRVVAYAEWAYRHRPWPYGEVRPIPHDPWLDPPGAIDCSAFAILAYKAAGVSIGLDGDREGNTTSLLGRGWPTANPRPGDLVFYRNPDHVGVYVGAGEVIEHGSSGGPRREHEWYRSVTAVRRYLP